MDIGINSWKDFWEFSYYIITSSSLLILWITYIISRKQIHFATMAKCMTDFREIMKPTMLPFDKIFENYIDLANEEFFYLENQYLPIDIAIEWTDGMIDYLPFFDVNGDFINSRNWSGLTSGETIRILNNYPRVFKAIQLNSHINFDLIHLEIIVEDDRLKRKLERDKLIKLMILKLNIAWWKKIRLGRNIASR